MPVINQDDFIRRLQRLYCKKCDAIDDCFCQLDYLICANDETDKLESQLMLWLLGENSQNVIIIFGKKAMYFLSSSNYLTSLRSSLCGETLVVIKNTIGIDIQFLKTCDNDSNELIFKEVTDLMRNDIEYGKIGVIDPKENGTSNFKMQWYQHLNNINWNKINMSMYAAYLMSIKDGRELELIKKACRFSLLSFMKIVEPIYEYLQCEPSSGQIITNMDICKQVKNAQKQYIGFDFCYDPVIQSGGFYNLTLQSGSDENELKAGVIILSFGIKYYQLCSSVTRTIFISSNCNDDVKNNYLFLVKVHKFIIDSLRDGVELGKVYQDTVTLVNTEKPNLVDKLTNNFGSAIGVQVEETFFQIKQDVKAIAKENMVFNVTCGFDNLINNSVTNGAFQNYSLWIGDTVKVRKEKPAYFFAPLYKGDFEIQLPRKNNY